jgi:hypothetical protein
MVDPAAEHFPTDHVLDADLVARFAHIGVVCTVADDAGFCFELRPKVIAGIEMVVTTRAGRLAAGRRVSGRCFDGSHARTLVFTVEAVEPTAADMADALLRLTASLPRGDERSDPRHGYDAEATGTLADPYGDRPDSRRSALRVCNISRSGLAFLADRRFDTGEQLDIAFSDETDAPIRCRVQLLRVERAVYGRSRFASRIVAIGELDQARLDRLCSRVRLREQAAEPEPADEQPLRELLASHSDRGGLRRLFSRA